MSQIKRISLKTKNIKKAKEEFASENSLEISQCDFKLNSVDTYIRDTTNKEFMLFSENLKKNFDDTDKILNEHIEFSQNYNITLFEIKECKIKLKHKIIYGDYSTNPSIIISPNSNIPYRFYKPNELLQIVYTEINKLKAEHNIIINLFDDSMIKSLKLFVQHIYTGKFTKQVKIPLFKGIAPEITQESKLVIKFLEKDINSQVIEVEENEILAIFYKPKFGKNGLDCYGKEINANYANNKEDLPQEVDLNTVKIEENESKKTYISKSKGFVQFDDKKLSIDNKIKMDKLSRVQSAIASEESNNIEVIISQKDTSKDSVGEGVELVSESVDISGHVGANSIIEAHTLNIDGATHQDSTQFAKYAKINRHKGMLRCHEADIKLLEGGQIHATKVNIETCLGGTVYAQDVNITHVKSNLKVYASNSITIKLISGEDNRLTIDYKKIPILVSKIELIEEDISELNFSLEEALRQKSSMIDNIKNEIKRLKGEISIIKDSVKNAKVLIVQPLKGLNTITFVIDDEHELSYKTQAQEYTEFYLETNEDKITLHPVNKTITL